MSMRIRTLLVVGIWLVMSILLLAPLPASAISSTGPTPANPWSVVPVPGYVSSSLYFSSPAEAAAYLIANWNAAVPADTFRLSGFPGPDTVDAPCSVATPCYGIYVTYSQSTDGINTGILAVVRNQGDPSQVCPDGSSAPVGQTCVGKSLGDCLCGVADPIDVGSGNVYEHFLDYSTSGQNQLQFVRHYNSRQGYSLANILGQLWRSTYDRYIRISSATSVTVERADGQQLQFNLVGGVWTPDSDVDITLTNSGTSWTLKDHEDTTEAYVTNSAGTSANLSSIAARNGYKQTLAYNSSAQISSVQDTYGRELNFTYVNGLLASVETPEGTKISYGYASVANGSNLTTVTYPTAPATSVTYLYENTGLVNALTGIIDERGIRSANWSYDAYSRGLTNSQGASGVNANLTVVTYNDTNGSRTVKNALGVVDSYTFTVLQGIPKVTGISRAKTATTAAATEAFGYDTIGHLASKTDWRGNKTTFVNNAHGDPTTINEAVGTVAGRTTSITYSSTWVHLPATIVTPGLTTSFTYDGDGEVLTKTLTDTTTTTSPYATKGQTRIWTNTWSNALLASVKTPNGNTTKYGYDATGSLTSTTDAKNHVTKITSHTGGGLPLTIVDPNSVTTTLTYSPRQWLTSSKISGSGGTYTTTRAYDAAWNLTQTTLPDGSYIVNAYDTAHRLTEVTDALGNYRIYTLDALGDRTAEKIYAKGASVPSWTQAGTFDALGRLLVETAGAGQTTTRTYDPNGNSVSVTDGLKHQTINTYDALNRLTVSTDANSGATTTTYDTHDHVVSVKDANGNTTSYTRDGFGEAIQQLSPDSGKTVFHYDGDGNLTSKTDALGIVTNQTFDALDRVLTTTYPADTAENVAYTYDQTGTGYTFGIGRLTSVTDAAGTLTRDYEERGNLSSEVRVNGKNTLTTRYTYDGAGRIASTTYPDGTLVSNSRNAAGYLTKVSATLPGAATATTLATVGHLPFGPLNSVTYGSGISETWNFDAAYRATGIADVLSGASAQKLTYVYDNANNIKTITDGLNAANTQNLGYDAVNRLMSAVSGAGGYGSLAWTYDKVGNRLTETAGTVVTPYTYTPGTNRLSAVGSVTVATNANGNITTIPPANSIAPATFAYNKANRLASVIGSPLAATFTYDWAGLRFSKTNPGTQSILYSYMQGGALLAENDNGSVIDYVYADGRPIANLRPKATPAADQVNYVIADHLGTPQLVVNSSNAVVWKTTYQPFGTTGLVSAVVPQNLRFPGQNTDAETGFSYNHNRDYMPNLGRYLESDPSGLSGGMNIYQYANANPGSFVDESGLSCLDDLRLYLTRLATAAAWAGAQLFTQAPDDYPEIPTIQEQLAEDAIDAASRQVAEQAISAGPSPLPVASEDGTVSIFGRLFGRVFVFATVTFWANDAN